MDNKQTAAIKLQRIVAKTMNDHLTGPQHSPTHKCIFGMLIMAFGVNIAKVGADFGYITHVSLDMLGYGIHAIGALPFLKSIEEGGKL